MVYFQLCLVLHGWRCGATWNYSCMSACSVQITIFTVHPLHTTMHQFTGPFYSFQIHVHRVHVYLAVATNMPLALSLVSAEWSGSFMCDCDNKKILPPHLSRIWVRILGLLITNPVLYHWDMPASFLKHCHLDCP